LEGLLGWRLSKDEGIPYLSDDSPRKLIEIALFLQALAPILLFFFLEF